MGLDYPTRLKIFRQQRLRKPIDSRLDLAQRHRLDDWRNDVERRAYELILWLHDNSQSPLCGQISLREAPRGQRLSGINAHNLWKSLCSVMSKGSPLYGLPLDKRAEAALNLIMAMSEAWARAWSSPDHVLRTSRGINAVLMLVVSGSNFRMVINNDFRPESLKAALMLVPKFNWTLKAHRNTSQREMTDNLDTAIQRAYQRQLESSEGATAVQV